MLIQTLENNNIKAIKIPTVGKGMSLRSGISEMFMIYVPFESYDEACDIYDIIWNSSNAAE